jgi:hypothetical protein
VPYKGPLISTRDAVVQWARDTLQATAQDMRVDRYQLARGSWSDRAILFAECPSSCAAFERLLIMRRAEAGIISRDEALIIHLYAEVALVAVDDHLPRVARRT